MDTFDPATASRAELTAWYLREIGYDPFNPLTGGWTEQEIRDIIRGLIDHAE